MQIEPATLQFLRDLAQHNDRDWFQDNKARYEAAHANMKAFVRAVEARLNEHDAIEEAKLYRIYRDVRFSKDKSPYKTNFGASFSRATALRRGGYYIHISPGESFVGGGFWQPERDDLKRMRTEFAADDSPMRAIMAAPDFQRYFGGLEADDLKTAPAGFDRNHPAIDLIRKKSYVASRSFSDREVLGESFLDETTATLRAMRPWFDYMSDVLTTNANGERIV